MSRLLEAEWRRMVVASYPVEARRLELLLPAGLEPDRLDGSGWVSLAALQFVRPRAFGLPLSFPASFSEINLRTYARIRGSNRRGLVFLSEVVSNLAAALAARLIQNKSYAWAPVRCAQRSDGARVSVEYAWSVQSHWNRLTITAAGDPAVPEPGSTAEFFTQHFRGFGRARDGAILCYEVEHPPWRTWTGEISLSGSGFSVPQPFSALLPDTPPVCAHLIEGGPVVVRRAVRIEP